MSRKKKWPPVPHAHRASGQDRVRINGKDVYLGPTGSAEAARNWSLLLLKLAEGKPPEAPPKRRGALTVAEVVELHAADARARYDPAGREAGQFDYACAPLLHVCGSLPACRFGVTQLEAARDEMIRRGWSRGVVNRRVVRLRTLFRWAELKGHVPPGVWAGLRALPALARSDRRARTTAPVKPPEWADFARVCRCCPRVVRDMLLVQLFAGLRSAEVRTMRAGEIERPADGEWVFRPQKHKNLWRGQTREVVFGPRTRAVLRKHLEGRKPGQYVFVSGYGKGGKERCYTDCSYPRAVARACERAGVPPFSPYDLRKLASIRAIRAGSLDHARSMLGHADVGTTARHYTDGVDLKLAAEIARKVG